MASEPARGTPTSADDAAGPGEPGQGPVALPTHRIRRTRTGGIWVAAALFALILLLLLIFILENGQRVSISYFGAHGHLPLGVALLLAAVIGVLLVVVPGTGRIIQLRVAARRHRRLDAQTAATVPAAPQAAHLRRARLRLDAVASRRTMPQTRDPAASPAKVSPMASATFMPADGLGKARAHSDEGWCQ